MSGDDISKIIVALAALVSAVGSVAIALFTALKTYQKIDDVHKTFNSKMDAFIAEVKTSWFKKGVESEKADALGRRTP